MEAYLRLKNVSQEFENKLILKNVNFEISEGEFASISGPSGIGKTSLLRIIAGLDRQKDGTIYLENEIISSHNFHLPPNKRNLGYVVQQKVLFPHLTIQQNVEFGIYDHKDKAIKAKEMLENFRVSDLLKKFPHEISGGEAQRVALARSLVTSPKLLLLDEPFNGLDKKLKKEIYPQLQSFLSQNKITCLMVTHDEIEIQALSKKNFLLEDSTIKAT